MLDYSLLRVKVAILRVRSISEKMLGNGQRCLIHLWSFLKFSLNTDNKDI